MAPGPVQPGLHQIFPDGEGSPPLDIFPTQEVILDVISSFTARYERSREEEMSLEDYLAECKRNPLAYATAAERMLKAIGARPEPASTR